MAGIFLLTGQKSYWNSCIDARAGRLLRAWRNFLFWEWKCTSTHSRPVGTARRWPRCAELACEYVPRQRTLLQSGRG
jgi:hypothetical protein